MAEDVSANAIADSLGVEHLPNDHAHDSDFGPPCLATVRARSPAAWPDANELDPVRVAASLDRNILNQKTQWLQSQHSWAMAVMLAILDADAFIELTGLRAALAPPVANRNVEITINGVKHRCTTMEANVKPHLDKMQEWRIVEKVSDGGAIKFTMKYFPVPKGNGVVWRIIIDARITNAVAAKPPKMRIISTRVLVRLILALGTHVFASTADFRHWFYQIEIPEGVRGFFGLASRREGRLNDLYRLVVLAMGFSWSPIIAQSIASLIAVPWDDAEFQVWDPRKKGAPRYFNMEGRETRTRDAETDDKESDISPPPYWIVHKNDQLVGFIVVYYDNVLYLTKDKKVRNRLTQIFESQAAKAKAVIKGSITLHDFYSAPGKLLQFLGMEIRLPGGPAQNAGILAIRHILSNAEKWQHWSIFENMKTLRDIAAATGIIVWDATVRGMPMGIHFEAFRALRRAAGVAKERKHWDKPISACGATEEEIRDLCARVRHITETNEWVAHPQHTFNQKAILTASDASSHGLGYMALAPNGKILRDERDTVFRANEHNEHLMQEPWATVNIARREMEAAERAMQMALDLAMSKGEQWIIAVAIDNTTAAGALRNGNSADEYLAKRAALWQQKMREHQQELLVVVVGTEDEAADEGSREKASDPERCKRCANILFEAVKTFTIGKGSFVENLPVKRERE